MKLTEEQRALLVKVKEALAAGPYPDEMPGHTRNYICWNVLIADQGEEILSVKDKSMFDHIKDSSEAAQQIVNAVEDAIDKEGCMENYLNVVFQVSAQKKGMYDMKSREKSMVFVHQARMAWVDRMLDTGEIA